MAFISSGSRKTIFRISNESNKSSGVNCGAKVPEWKFWVQRSSYSSENNQIQNHIFLRIREKTLKILIHDGRCSTSCWHKHFWWGVLYWRALSRKSRNSNSVWKQINRNSYGFSHRTEKIWCLTNPIKKCMWRPRKCYNHETQPSIVTKRMRDEEQIMPKQ